MKSRYKKGASKTNLVFEAPLMFFLNSSRVESALGRQDSVAHAQVHTAAEFRLVNLNYLPEEG